MSEAFELVVPYTDDKRTKLMKMRVYAYEREEVETFIRQHNIKYYEVNILYAEQIGKDFADHDVLKPFLFASNRDNEKYEILTTETLIYEAIDYIAEQIADSSIYGDAILRTDIPIIDIINRLIEKMKHSVILDYAMLDDTTAIEEMEQHIRTFSNKALELEDNPDESDRMYDYVYDSLHNASMLQGSAPESITIEGYVEYFATMITDTL